MRRLILCVDTESPYDKPEGYWTYCVSISEAYAKIHSIDFKYIQTSSILGRNPSWSRIPTVLKYIDDYDEILCINAAVAIINHSVDAFEYLKTAKPSDWPRDASVKPLLYTVVDKPSNKTHACSGIFLLDCVNKERAKSVMEDWWNDCPDKRYETEFPYEQAVWNIGWANKEKGSILRVADIWTAQEYDKDQVFMHIIDAYKLARVFEAKKYFYRLLQSNTQHCKKRIGIFVRQQNYYTNGAGQNCIFMKQSLEATGHDVDLIVLNMDQKKPFVSDDISYIYKDFANIPLANYCTFVIGSYLPPKPILDQLKSNAIEIVMFNPCNPFDQFHNDNFLYSCKSSETPLQEMLFHKFANQVWITENHKETGKTYLEVINRNQVPINPVPLIWNPLFLYYKHKLPMYTNRTKKQADIVIIEPNINYCKSGWLPLVICEKLYLEKPYSIRNVYFFNAPEKNPTAMGMIQSLKLHEDKKIKLLSRMQINEILDHFANKTDDYPVIFLSHQTHLPMNYAYYDVLSCGFPFVHNSKVLKARGLGYAYDEVDISTGSKQLQTAIQTHNVERALKDVAGFLYENDPYNPDVVNIFQSFLNCK
jgi:hypothetical protein